MIPKPNDEAPLETSKQEVDEAQGELDEEIFQATKKAGHEAFGGQRYEEAYALYTNAIAMRARDPGLYSNRSGVLFLLGRYKEAEKDAVVCLQLDPAMQVARGYVRLGSALLAQQKNEAAERVLRKGLALAPTAKDPEVGRELQVFLDSIPNLAHTRDHELVIGEDESFDAETEELLSSPIIPLLDDPLTRVVDERELQKTTIHGDNHGNEKVSVLTVHEPFCMVSAFSCFPCVMTPCHGLSAAPRTTEVVPQENGDYLVG